MNRTEENQQRDPHIYDELIFYNSPKVIDGRKNNLFNKWYFNNLISIHKQKTNQFIPHTIYKN